LAEDPWNRLHQHTCPAMMQFKPKRHRRFFSIVGSCFKECPTFLIR
jgi:hypothetical protein